MLAQITKVSSRFMQALIPNMAASSAAMPSTAPWGDYWYQSMGLPNAAGVMGGDDAYQFVSACFAATRLYCSVGATMPLNRTQFTMEKDGRTTRVMSSDPLHKMINLTPNPEQSAMSFRSMMVEWQVNRGTAFAEIQREQSTIRGVSGRPVAYWPIHPSRCRPFRSENDGSLWWHVRNNNGSDTNIPDVDMLRIPYIIMDKTGLRGIGVADRATSSIQLGQSLDRTENDATMSGVPRIVVESDKPMAQPEQAAFRRQWRELYIQGGEGVGLLVNGMKAKPLSWSATDSAHVPRREFNIEEIARWYDVPPTLLRRAIKESAGNVEQLGQEFQTYSLRFLEAWEQELNIKTLSESERDSGQAWVLNYKSLLKANHVGRATRAAALFPIGGINSNEVRDEEDLNPYPEGGKYFVQGALRPIDEPYSASDPQNPPQDPKSGKRDPLKSPKALALKAGARTMLEDCLRRLTAKEAKAAVRASAKPTEWHAWIDEFHADHEPWAITELTLPLQTCAVFGLKMTAKEFAAKFVAESRQALLDVSDGPNDEFAARVKVLAEDWETNRAASAVRAIAELN